MRLFRPIRIGVVGLGCWGQNVRNFDALERVQRRLDETRGSAPVRLAPAGA